VRDVLERSIATQLRKIAFSALVYGALVIVCLGGVVWSLSFAVKGVLPLHWSSSEPVLEFPVDLLFYNFVVPLAIRAIKPSDTIHQMYNWWFHNCARMLRLTSFLFGERELDEEGHHVNRSWRDVCFGTRKSSARQRGAGKPEFVRDGRFVRTPASDQVRLPKGAAVFVAVNESNERIDGKPDRDDGLHGKGNEMFTHVYIPPSFRARISAFIFLIWVFAAVTGIGTTILPLLLGRRMLASLFPEHVRVNDIYAFSAGIGVVGSFVYAAIHCQRAVAGLGEHIRPYARSPTRMLSETWRLTCRVMSLVYAFFTLVLFFPSMFALLSELYIFVPLHTCLYGEKPPVINFVQDWTLGVLYLRMALKFISWYRMSRLDLALDGVIRDGWMEPDMRLATRAFIVPSAVVGAAALLGPLPLGYFLNLTIFRDAPSSIHSQVFRYCYPAFLLAILTTVGVRWLRRQIGLWRVSIRDDVYLIGERLHNFTGRRAMDVGVTRRVATS
jgi:E3 ubiquitin-protein ligase MARCH6